MSRPGGQKRSAGRRRRLGFPPLSWCLRRRILSPKGLRTQPTCASSERRKACFCRPFVVIGETGSEPAIARPPGTRFRFCAVRFRGLDRCRVALGCPRLRSIWTPFGPRLDSECRGDGRTPRRRPADAGSQGLRDNGPREDPEDLTRPLRVPTREPPRPLTAAQLEAHRPPSRPAPGRLRGVRRPVHRAECRRCGRREDEKGEAASARRGRALNVVVADPDDAGQVRPPPRPRRAGRSGSELILCSASPRIGTARHATPARPGARGKDPSRSWPAVHRRDRASAGWRRGSPES
jgi:hypothetical protein